MIPENRPAVPAQWQNTRRFVQAGFKVRFAEHDTGHRYGGAPRHNGAQCFTCQTKLRLVWEINLYDERLPNSLRDAFPGREHLAFYYCFNCPQATTYQIQSEAAVRCVDPAGHEGGDETPYAYEANVPDELPRRAIHLEQFPPDIDQLLSKETEVGFDKLDRVEREQLSAFLAKPLSSAWDVVFSQFGGLPVMVQGHWDIKCPNPDCSATSCEDDRDFLMKELAVVERDSVCGFNWVYAPLAYHICWVCGTIEGNFRCS